MLPDVEFIKVWEVPNAKLLERTLHKHFRGCNVGGEWFEVSAEAVSATVKSLVPTAVALSQ